MIKNDFKITSLLWGVPCSIIAVYAIIYFAHLGERWSQNVVSVPTFFIEAIKIVIFLILGVIGFVYMLFILKMIIINLPHFIRELPSRMRYEKEIIKRIWGNRGLKKYNVFGGIGFYLRLRLKVLAFVFAFFFFASIFYFAYQQYQSYEPTHWHENVYHHSDPKVFRFKKDVPYTICLHGSSLEYIYVNGSFFIGSYSPFIGEPNFYILPGGFRLHNTFNITFHRETNFAMLLHTEMVWNDIEAKEYEIWENKKEGEEYHCSIFDPLTYKTDDKTETSSDNKTNKRKKK